MKTPRTDEIMILVRKAFNATNVKDGIKHLEAAHDAIEKLEKDYISGKSPGTEASA